MKFVNLESKRYYKKYITNFAHRPINLEKDDCSNELEEKEFIRKNLGINNESEFNKENTEIIINLEDGTSIKNGIVFINDENSWDSIIKTSDKIILK